MCIQVTLNELSRFICMCLHMCVHTCTFNIYMHSYVYIYICLKAYVYNMNYRESVAWKELEWSEGRVEVI